WGWSAIFLTLGGGGALLWLVCWRALPETHPEPDPDSGRPAYVWNGFRAVLLHPESTRYALTVCFSYSGMFAYISGSPFVFIEVFHVARQHFGLFFAMTAAALMAGATVNRALLRRLSPLTLL